MTPLSLSSLEARKKVVHHVDGFRNLYPNSDAVIEGMLLIRKAIENGAPIPERYYRANRTTTRDPLLEQTGIMHLHVTGNPSDNELLFLIQYPNDVIFLEVAGHEHFKNEPPGSVLRSLHKAGIAKAHAAILAAHTEAADKVRASLAAFMQGKPKA